MQRMPPVELLPSLVALLETQSVTKAAARMHVSQPAMSRTLSRLRDVIGDALLVRSGNHLTCTLKAELMLPSARGLLEQAIALLTPTEPFDCSTQGGTVTLALGDDMQCLLMSRLLARIRKDAPQVDIRVRPLGLESTSALRRGHVDLAVMPDLRADHPELHPAELAFTPCYERRFVVVTRQPRRFTLQKFLAAEHLLVSPSGDDHGYVDEALKAHGRARRIAVTVPTFNAAFALVKQTDLVATLPDDLTRHLAPKLHVEKCPVATPTLNIGVLWAKRFEPDPRHVWLRTLACDVVKSLDGSGMKSPTRAFANAD